MPHINHYETELGFSPFEDWFLRLDSDVARRVQIAVTRIELGNMGDVKPVGEGVSERRLDFGPGYRIYFGQDRVELVILLGGGTKKRQQRDIEVAKAYWADYKRRKTKGK
ncbi:type II toxin-antitoxin system RelE/ParE family toxin [Novipirellula sp. SH528]|uniref:type II toxin-antitoxin system RelE/ParE family toxin n=1 Tax=Novipirellula sp. SH528 TaxID=3454466 RepID=UPI003FA1063F